VNEPIASGREADIFALAAGRVLRRYRRVADVTGEAAVMTHVAAHGYPVPADSWTLSCPSRPAIRCGCWTTRSRCADGN
jgi:hypothetical protein